MNTPGSRIRKRRKELKLTQVELAGMVGLDQSTLSDIENGAAFLADRLLPLAKALMLSPEQIMSGDDALNPGLHELRAAWLAMSQVDRVALLNTASAFAQRRQVPATSDNGKRKATS